MNVTPSLLHIEALHELLECQLEEVRGCGGGLVVLRIAGGDRDRTAAQCRMLAGMSRHPWQGCCRSNGVDDASLMADYAVATSSAVRSKTAKSQKLSKGTKSH